MPIHTRDFVKILILVILSKPWIVSYESSGMKCRKVIACDFVRGWISWCFLSIMRSSWDGQLDSNGPREVNELSKIEKKVQEKTRDFLKRKDEVEILGDEARERGKKGGFLGWGLEEDDSRTKIKKYSWLFQIVSLFEIEDDLDWVKVVMEKLWTFSKWWWDFFVPTYLMGWGWSGML